MKKTSLILTAVFAVTAILCWMTDTLKAQTGWWIPGTNVIVVLNTNLPVMLTNSPVTVSNTVTVQGNVGFTNAAQTNIGVTNVGGASSLPVKGWPILTTNILFTVPSGAALTNGAAIAPILEIDGIATDTNSPSVLLCATYICNTNCPLVAKIQAHFFSMAPTALGSSGAILTTYTDNTNYMGSLSFTNWHSLGTNMVCTMSGQNIGTSLRTNWVIFACEATYTNNTGTGISDCFKVTYQKAY